MTKLSDLASLKLNKSPQETLERLLHCLQESANFQHRPLTIQIDLRQTHIHNSFNDVMSVDSTGNQISFGYADSPVWDTISRQDLVEQVQRLERQVQLLTDKSELLQKLMAVYEDQIIRLTAYPQAE